MRHPVLRYGAAALCVLGAVYFLLPLSMGVLHIGMLYPAAGLLLAAVWLVFPGLFRLWPRWLRRTVCVVLVAGVLVLGTILTLMGHPGGPSSRWYTAGHCHCTGLSGAVRRDAQSDAPGPYPGRL